MYRQINLKGEDQKYQRILWRNDPKQSIKVYELRTLTYGTAPASFLATRCLRQLANDSEESCRSASEVIKHDFYMDDLLSGAVNESEAALLKQQLESILSSAGFVLRKWISNKSNILARTEKHDESHYIISEDDNIKTLGITWDSTNDQFEFLVNENKSVLHVSKRTILSTIAKIFDPIGLLASVTIKAKCFIQRLWEEKLEWDQSVPPQLFTEWLQFSKQLPSLSNLAIPRQITINYDKLINYQLHGFSDASEKGYGACIYLRGSQDAGQIKLALVCSKSRVAPVKKITLPRLELCGALLLAKLMEKTLSSLKGTISNCKVYYWCDSTIVLHWLAKPPGTWKTFVCNRVSSIQRIASISNWSHVRSSQNPADIISQGCSPSELQNCSLWWNGPAWLSQGADHWPSEALDELTDQCPDKTVINNCVNINVKLDFDIFERFSSYKMLIRTVAWIYQFFKNLRTASENRSYSNLSGEELQHAILKLSSSAQV